LQNTLIIGYGNPDRQDDGAAWHIIVQLTERLGLPVPEAFEEGIEPTGGEVDFLFRLQLTPEIAEIVAGYQRVCFIDAHTGTIPEDVRLTPVEPQFQNSPFTHHLTPESCLSLAEALYGALPEAVLASVRGYDFQFSHELTPRTAQNVREAVEQILSWLKQV
jgi:hydrogenase maturation protease